MVGARSGAQAMIWSEASFSGVWVCRKLLRGPEVHAQVRVCSVRGWKMPSSVPEMRVCPLQPRSVPECPCGPRVDPFQVVEAAAEAVATSVQMAWAAPGPCPSSDCR